MSIHNVVLIGAGGNLGPSMLKGLLDAKLNVTVLSRQGSKSTFPSHVKVVQIAEDYPHAELVKAFKGHEAVISTAGGAGTGTQTRFIDAAIEAGVYRYIPAEFGSPPEPGKSMQAGKAAIREYLSGKESSTFTWTGVINSAFFDWGLVTPSFAPFLKLDIRKRTQTVMDTGDQKFPVSTFSTVAAATVGVLRHPEETKNRLVYVQSFSTSFNEMRHAVEKALGEKIEVVERVNSATYILEQEAKAKKGDIPAVYNHIWALIGVGADWSGHLDNKLLEIPEEDFQQTVDKAVKEALAQK